MSDHQIVAYNRATALLTSEAEDSVKQAARKLMRMTPGGNRLGPEEATDLAVYSLLTGLNPFNGECYYMTKVGPVPGIAGYRVKAMDWIMHSLMVTGARVDTTPRIWEEYRIATTEEADYDPAVGDVAWICTLYDSVSRDAWETRRITLGMRYREMGATFQEAYDLSSKDVGPCPKWEAVGVVHATEHFSGEIWRDSKKIEGEYKPEMWDRNERAKKRAAKGCYRKGFPKLNIPDAEEGQYVPDEAKDLKIKVIDALKTEKRPAHTESENMRALGFEPDVKNTPAAPGSPQDLRATATVVESVLNEDLAPTEATDAPGDTLEPWMITEDSNTPYVDIATPQLSGRLNNILKRKPMTEEDEARKNYIQSILAERNKKPVQK